MLKKAMVLAAIALAGCGPQGEAQDAVKQLLNDPDSAKFSAMTTSQSGNVCGLVNAKNRMGGYVGDTPFFYEPKARYAAIVSAPDDGDFRMLWLSLKTKSGFDEQFDRLTARCRHLSRWADVCGSAYPAPSHRMCAAMGNGTSLYHALSAEYGR